MFTKTKTVPKANYCPQPTGGYLILSLNLLYKKTNIHSEKVLIYQATMFVNTNICHKREPFKMYRVYKLYHV